MLHTVDVNNRRNWDAIYRNLVICSQLLGKFNLKNFKVC